MRKIDWNDIQEAWDSDRPVPGAYIIKITNVKDVESKEYLLLEYDFAEGQYKGYYQDLFDTRSFWGGSFVKSYKEKALPFFKAFKTCLEASNPGYRFDEDDVMAMIGTRLGVVLGDEEYIANDGTKKHKLYVAQVKKVEDIVKGNFEPAPAKTLKPAADPYFAPAPAFQELSDGELPF